MDQLIIKGPLEAKNLKGTPKRSFNKTGSFKDIDYPDNW